MTRYMQPVQHIHIITSGFPRIMRVEPIRDGVIRLVRARAVWMLSAIVDGIPFAFTRGTTTRAIAEQAFEEERHALSSGMDIMDPASGWEPLE